MKPLVSVILLIAASLLPAFALPDVKDAKRILFLGDSITYDGNYVTDVEAWLLSSGAAAEVINLGLPSETAADLTSVEQEESHIKPYGFPRPTVSERLQRVLEKTRPDWVFACYGMNDGSSLPHNEEGLTRFSTAVEKLKAAVDNAGVKRFIMLTPPIHDAGPGKPQSQHDAMLARFSQWLLSKRRDGWEVIDVHGPMRAALEERRKAEPDYRFAGDGVHPNREGHRLIAKQIIAYFSSSQAANESFEQSSHLGAGFRKLIAQRVTVIRDAWLTETKHARPGIAAGLPLDQAETKVREISALLQEQAVQPFPGTKSQWNGFERYDFPVGEDKLCSVITPANPLPGKSWAWKGEFLDAFPKTEIELLKRGVYIVYLSAPNLLGAPEAVRHWNHAYAELTRRYGLAKRPALIGLSRGGLYCYNWAIANPDKVACIYGDAPVMDIKSWPGGKGKGKGSPNDWELARKVYGLKDETEALAFKGNPTDNLKSLAEARVPLFHVYGDADDVVPWEENTGIVAERYKQLGGSIELMGKPGVGHHPHGLNDPSPVVEWILKNLQAANRSP
ncbi:MAG TPA: GDSL-type esterase/lipase family protein [Chthoniobacteraceae bacterium]|jgi:lysophospholipase L1-like esterase/pimeloyl-ACP methyl ester carboxylesterase